MVGIFQENSCCFYSNFIGKTVAKATSCDIISLHSLAFIIKGGLWKIMRK